MIEMVDLLITGICFIGITIAFFRLYLAVKEYRSSSVANEKLGLTLNGKKK